MSIGAPPCAFSPPVDISTFISSLNNTQKAVDALLPLVQSPELKVAMQMLVDLTKGCGFSLSREISLGVSQAMENEKRAYEVVLSGVPCPYLILSQLELKKIAIKF